ncbi:MAG: diacylglycerol kinase family lipid kinase [Lachnospiraceae bacterium]|nr:diacylglycerol kinase family lipid kinase [Lachnospiraceae bacterium]
MKLLFIYNPHSGKAQIRSNLLDIIDIFVKSGYEVTAHPTQSSADAANAVRDRHSDYDLIVCSGGDGTLNEVVSGMMQSGTVIPIGYIPAGSTNDFAKSLKIPGFMLPAAKVIPEGHIFKCDVGELNGGYYVYVAAFGIFTEVTYATPQNIKNTLGYSAYILEAIKSLPTIRAYHMHVKWEDGEIEDDFIYGMVTNSISVGGFKGITGHHVLLDDGFHEVTLIKNPTTPIELSDIVRAMVDRRMDSANIITFKSKHVYFESSEPVRWTRDGEFGGEHTSAEIIVHPRAVDIIVPDQ